MNVKSTRAGLNAIAACFFGVSSLTFAADPLSLVNPLQGTDSTRDFSHGNLYPAIALPFPMHVWAPYTQPAKDPFYYQYRQTQIRGIRQTHQPSPWIGDYASFALMPVSGRLAVTEDDRASEFRHEMEVAQPSYYSVRLDTWNATAEVTPTERAASFRFTFEKPEKNYLILDAFKGGSSVEIIPSERKIKGTCRNNRGGVPENFTNYFVIQFDQPFVASGTWTPKEIHEGQTTLSADHVGAYLEFETKGKQKVSCKVASSYISFEQAQRNLDQEIGSANFDTIRTEAEIKWNDALNRIRIEGGSVEQQKTFYTTFYRCLLFPHKFYEFDAKNQPVYYSPHDGKIHSGHLYTDTGYWDTFRAAHPLYNLLFPEISAEVIEGILATYDQSGWLPSWTSPGHRECMIGNHAFSLLADAWAKGIRNFDPAKAVDAMKHDANNQSPAFCRSIGRDGAEPYHKLGYVPYPEFKEATAKTLEYAYDDFCAATLAQAAGRDADAKSFLKGALNYKNVFDREVGFVRGRKIDGSWRENFDPIEWGGPFTEGNSWHWTWSVFHDIPGLISLMGGDEAFGKKLDAVFTTTPEVKVGTYRRTIHEMNEMVAANTGQYAHGNQPVHHLIYLYNSIGQPWKTQSRIREMANRLYHATPDGYCGDEDNGQMGAWYVFSALGFYPVCPGTPDYAIGSPLFDRAVISLPNGKELIIKANKNGPLRPYIQSASWNGKPFDQTWITHSKIVEGGTLEFDMSSAPNLNWGASPESRPPGGMK